MISRSELKKTIGITGDPVIKFSILWRSMNGGAVTIRTFTMLHSTYQDTIDRMHEFMLFMLLNDSKNPRHEFTGLAERITPLSISVYNTLYMLYTRLSMVPGGQRCVFDRHVFPTLVDNVRIVNHDVGATHWPEIVPDGQIEDLSKVSIDDVSSDECLESELLNLFYRPLISNTVVWICQKYGIGMYNHSLDFMLKDLYENYVRHMNDHMVIEKAALVDRFSNVLHQGLTLNPTMVYPVVKIVEGSVIPEVNLIFLGGYFIKELPVLSGVDVRTGLGEFPTVLQGRFGDHFWPKSELDLGCFVDGRKLD